MAPAAKGSQAVAAAAGWGRGWIEWKEERSFTGAWAWAFWVASGPSIAVGFIVVPDVIGLY